MVRMPRGVRGGHYLVLARENLLSYVEGRALSKQGQNQLANLLWSISSAAMAISAK